MSQSLPALVTGFTATTCSCPSSVQALELSTGVCCPEKTRLPLTHFVYLKIEESGEYFWRQRPAQGAIITHATRSDIVFWPSISIISGSTVPDDLCSRSTRRRDHPGILSHNTGDDSDKISPRGPNQVESALTIPCRASRFCKAFSQWRRRRRRPRTSRQAGGPSRSNCRFSWPAALVTRPCASTADGPRTFALTLVLTTSSYIAILARHTQPSQGPRGPNKERHGGIRGTNVPYGAAALPCKVVLVVPSILG